MRTTQKETRDMIAEESVLCHNIAYHSKRAGFPIECKLKKLQVPDWNDSDKKVTFFMVIKKPLNKGAAGHHYARTQVERIAYLRGINSMLVEILDFKYRENL